MLPYLNLKEVVTHFKELAGTVIHMCSKRVAGLCSYG